LEAIELAQRIAARFPIKGNNSRKYPAKGQLSGLRPVRIWLRTPPSSLRKPHVSGTTPN